MSMLDKIEHMEQNIKTQRCNFSQLLFIAPVILFYYLLYTYGVFQFNPKFGFIKVAATILSNKIVFMVSTLGRERLDNEGVIKRYLTALSDTMPNAKVVLGVSSETIVSQGIFDYQLEVEIYRCPFALIESEVFKIYGNVRWYYVPITTYYYGAIRFQFYKEYLSNHTDLSYVMITDRDALILRNPFDLLRTDTEAVHIMEDYFPFTKTGDWNYQWLNAFHKLNASIKNKCNYREITDFSNILPKIPLNSGTYLGKRENILIIANKMTEKVECHGIFKLGAEQGMLNYIILSGEFEGTGLRIKRYPCPSAMISCPDWVPLAKFAKYSKTMYLIHHYIGLSKEYYDTMEPRTLKFINLQ